MTGMRAIVSLPLFILAGCYTPTCAPMVDSSAMIICSEAAGKKILLTSCLELYNDQ